eukprot:557116-Prymnesium_polylepis.1
MSTFGRQVARGGRTRGHVRGSRRVKLNHVTNHATPPRNRPRDRLRGPTTWPYHVALPRGRPTYATLTARIGSRSCRCECSAAIIKASPSERAPPRDLSRDRHVTRHVTPPCDPH